MYQHERQLVLDQLASSEALLLALTENLTPEQWNFRESPNRWSIAENIEHVILFENFLMQTLARVTSELPQPDKKLDAASKEHLAHTIASDRANKFNAREIVRPVGKWADTRRMLSELRSTRARTIAYVAETQCDLRSHFFAHVAFGDLDCYQWLVVMAQHGTRHARQIEQIMADPAYPAHSRRTALSYAHA